MSPPEIQLLALYKGHDLLSAVSRSVAPDNVYNISNFGNKVQCYADVDRGRRYLLFLTLYDKSLSAQYDDLFGAAETFTEFAERDLLEYIGESSFTPY